MSKSEYNVSLEELKELMKARKKEDRDAIDDQYGGTTELCQKLNTDPQNGISNDEKELENRRTVFGANEIPPKPFLVLVWEAIQVGAIIET